MLGCNLAECSQKEGFSSVAPIVNPRLFDEGFPVTSEATAFVGIY